jgi:hypothetical protein
MNPNLVGIPADALSAAEMTWLASIGVRNGEG